LFSPPLGFVEILEQVAGLLCFFFNTDFNLITLLFELMAADNFCKVGVIGTDGEHAAVGDVEDDDEDEDEDEVERKRLGLYAPLVTYADRSTLIKVTE
jgi:hypothetical protein